MNSDRLFIYLVLNNCNVYITSLIIQLLFLDNNFIPIQILIFFFVCIKIITKFLVMFF